MRRSSHAVFLASVLLGAAVISGTGCGSSSQPTQAAGGLLAPGGNAPQLHAEDHLGKAVDMPAKDGHVQLVYFYPRDNTPGCTTEACALRDAWDKYTEAGVEVIGVSSDSAEKHREFATEHKLPFSLVADEDHAWGKAFGVDATMGMYQRVSFLIGKDGKVAQVFPKVDPAIHAQEVLAAVAKL